MRACVYEGGLCHKYYVENSGRDVSEFVCVSCSPQVGDCLKFLGRKAEGEKRKRSSSSPVS